MQPAHVLLRLCLVVVLYSRTLRTRPLDRNQMEELRPPDGDAGWNRGAERRTLDVNAGWNRGEDRRTLDGDAGWNRGEERRTLDVNAGWNRGAERRTLSSLEEETLEEEDVEDSAVEELMEEEELMKVEEEEVMETLEEEEELDWEARVEARMKEEVLRALELPRAPEETHRVTPPDYMLQLYNTYASSSAPSADVIRSYCPVDTEQTEGEELLAAALPQKDQSSPRLLDEREVAWSRGSWEMFDVTAALRSGAACGRGEAEFEVQVQRAACGGGAKVCGGVAEAAMVSSSVTGNTSAVLIVFSNDQRGRRHDAQQELLHMLSHEDEAVFSGAHEPSDPANDPRDALGARRRRRRRQVSSGSGGYCRRASLRVSFEDIGWHEWIVAPPEYEAYECVGACQFPLSAEVTPSKHAVIQTLVSLRHPGSANAACCVPTRLDPITIMYQENGVITVRHLYEEMRVAACGCR
ncbi:growth/differentiation factor 2-like [Sardina pilchardus]|uniref:growth/differentiation factor 2-like n=1 Tax=Sardina pilchardus TaxID=27697 RepID=UPI002E0D7EBC